MAVATVHVIVISAMVMMVMGAAMRMRVDLGAVAVSLASQRNISGMVAHSPGSKTFTRQMLMPPPSSAWEAVEESL
jgi:hypothetical protein